MSVNDLTEKENKNITGKITDKIGKNLFLLLAFLWGLLWILPWASWLNFLPWVRLGISILVFATPGMTISLLLAGKRLSLPAHFTSGLAISVFFVASLGLIGRVFHLPFAYIKAVCALTGLVGLLILNKYFRSVERLYAPKKISVITLVLFLGIATVGVIFCFRNGFGGDNLSYLAYLTNWQHAQSLSFREVIFGSGNLDIYRFWLDVFPMNLALLAEISHIHGLLLLGFYIEPALIILALLAAYNLYEDLFQSEYQAIAALLLHVTFLFLLQVGLEPGSAFFYRLSEDKAFAAFILAPVFFLAMRCFSKSFTPRMGIFFLLSGLSLTITHPVMLAYSVLVAGIYISIETLIERNYRKFGIVIALLVLILLPAAVFRFLPLANKIVFTSNTANYSINSDPSGGGRISAIAGTPFYGFDLDILQIKTSSFDAKNPLQIFLSWSYLWILGLGFLWSLFNLKRNPTAPFIAATSLLVLLCAIPYTGWLMGYAVSIRQLWRSPWFSPIGLSGAVLLGELLKFILHKVSIKALSKISPTQAALGLIVLISFALIGYFSIYVYTNTSQLLTQLDANRNNLEELSALGDYLETNIQSPGIFAAPKQLGDYLPGLSSKSKVVFFRGIGATYNYIKNYRDSRNRQTIIHDFVSLAPLNKEQMATLKKLGVQYLIVSGVESKDYYAMYPEFSGAQQAGNFWILKFHTIK